MLSKKIVERINSISLQLNLSLLNSLLSQAFLLCFPLLFYLVGSILIALLLNLIDNRICILGRDKTLHHRKSFTDNIEHLGNTLTFLRHCFLCQFSLLDKFSSFLVKSIIHTRSTNIRQKRFTCLNTCLIRLSVSLHRIFRIGFECCNLSCNIVGLLLYQLQFYIFSHTL